MKLKLQCLPRAMIIAVIFNVFSVFAQTAENRQAAPPPPVVQTRDLPDSIDLASASPSEILAGEIGQLRKSLQTLNARLKDVSEKLTLSDAKKNDDSNAGRNRVLLNLEILSRAEQRAEILRKQLIELIEKETSVKTRLVQMEEDIRPENIERSFNSLGSTRAPEIRDNRRRALEAERGGLENLQNQIYQSRQRLEESVRQADLLVETLRKTVFPLIRDAVQNVNSN